MKEKFKPVSAPMTNLDITINACNGNPSVRLAIKDDITALESARLAHFLTLAACGGITGTSVDYHDVYRQLGIARHFEPTP